MVKKRSIYIALVFSIAFIGSQVFAMADGGVDGGTSEPEIADATNESSFDSPYDSFEQTRKREFPYEYTNRIRKRRKKGRASQVLGEIASSVFQDILVLHKNLFTWNTFKIVSTVFPLFVGARMLDEKLQRCFYDASCHRNINQMPSWCHDVAKVSIALPIVLLGSDALFAKDDDRRWTGQIFLLGIPFVIWTKKLVKQMKFEACLRPWHERFSCEDRSFGGFPSGHMAQALYMAVLYGTRYGPRYALPLGLLASFIGVTFVTCNRHYFSQVIAGSAFGTIYALAASKLVDTKLADKVNLGLGVDEVGNPTLSLSMRW